MHSSSVSQMKSHPKKSPAPTAGTSRNMGNKIAVLWDMDGVLVDSGELHFQSWQQTLLPLAIPYDRKKFDATFGMNNYGILTLLMGRPPEQDFFQMVSDRKEILFRELIHGQMQMLPGARMWLEKLHENGIRQAVASSAPCENIEAIIDELEIRQYFAALVSAFALPSKPDPAVFLEAASQLGCEPSACTVVEDSVAGVAAARKAQMRCIAVTTTHPRSSLVGADLIVDSLEALTPFDFSIA